ncbi:XRE family transcriptional regulator [Staphylococcus gallinarum]
MIMNTLYNLRNKHNLDIEELTNKLNKIYGTKYEVHQLWEWENHKKDPNMKDALVLANFFNTSYEEFLDSKMRQRQKEIMDVEIRDVNK